MGLRSCLFACALFGLSTLAAHADEGDEHWSPLFALPGADDHVYSSIEFGGNLVIGGAFIHVGTDAAARVARWDGGAWGPMGDGFDGTVRALAVHDGALYAAGDFDHTGAVAADGIARWDGAAWQPLAAPAAYHSIRALCTYQGELIIGGIDDWTYDEYHAYERAGIARWDGAQRIPLAQFDYAWEGCIYALAAHGGYLVAGGIFDSLNGDYGIAHIARWNGWFWEGYAQSLATRSLLVHDFALYAGGGTLRRWTGTEWETQGGGLDGTIHGMTSYADGIAACGSISVGGSYGAGFWDGAAWSSIGSSFGNPSAFVDPTLHTVSTYDGLLVAGGTFNHAGQTAIPHVAAWDGVAWRAIADPQDEPRFNGLDLNAYTIGVFGDRIVAGGSFDFGYGTSLNGVGLWDGETWTSMGSGVPGLWDCVYSQAEYQGELVVGGNFPEISGVVSPNLAAWTGTEWRAFGDGLPGTCRVLLAEGGDLYLARAPDTYGAARIVERWDGESWSDLAGGFDGWVFDLRFYDGALVAGGAFTADSGGQPLGGIAWWDGAAWQPLGAGFDDTVMALMPWNGDLIAAGSFTTADGQPAAGIASWDGEAWRPLTGIEDGYIRMMAVYHGDLIVAGEFSAIGGVPADNIARWDGRQWAPLGSGIERTYYWGPYVNDLAVHGDALYACGSFGLAGGKSSLGIACWTESLTGVAAGEPPRPAPSLASWPNPFNPRTEIRFSVGRPGPVDLEVYSPSGRLVETLLKRAQVRAGDHVVTWDARGHAAGVYLCRLKTEEGASSARMVLLK